MRKPVRGLRAHEAVMQAPPGPGRNHHRRAPHADHAAVRQDREALRRGARHAQGHGSGVGVPRETLGSLDGGTKGWIRREAGEERKGGLGGMRDGRVSAATPGPWGGWVLVNRRGCLFLNKQGLVFPNSSANRLGGFPFLLRQTSTERLSCA